MNFKGSQNFFVVLGVVCLIVFFVTKKKKVEFVAPNSNATQDLRGADAPSNKKLGNSAVQTYQVAQDINQPAKADNVAKAISHVEYIETKVKEKLRLKVTLPTDYKFQDLSFEDVEIATGFHGYDNKTNTHLVLAGVRKTLQPNEVIAFLKESGTDLPGFDPRFLKVLQEPKRGVAHGGFDQPYVWEIESGGKAMTIALVNRTDGRGSYVAILNGPSKSLSDQEERFEGIYDSMKAE